MQCSECSRHDMLCVIDNLRNPRMRCGFFWQCHDMLQVTLQVVSKPRNQNRRPGHRPLVAQFWPLLPSSSWSLSASALAQPAGRRCACAPAVCCLRALRALATGLAAAPRGQTPRLGRGQASPTCAGPVMCASPAALLLLFCSAALPPGAPPANVERGSCVVVLPCFLASL